MADIRNQNPVKKTVKDPIKKSVIPRSIGVYSFLWLAAINLLLFAAWRGIPESFFPFHRDSLLGFSVITLLRFSLCLFAPFLFFTFREKLSSKSFFGKNPGIGWFLLSVLLGVPSAFLLTALHNLLLRAFLLNGISVPFPSYFFSPTHINDTPALFLFVIAGVLLPILSSEIFFRGILLPIFPTKNKGILNILLTALVFSIFMQSPIDLIPLFLFGIVLGVIKKTSNHVLCSIVTFFSTISTILLLQGVFPFLPYATSRADMEAASTLFSHSLIAIGGAFLLFLILFSQCRRNVLEEKKINRIRGTSDVEYSESTPLWPLLFGFLFLLSVWVFFYN